MHKSKKIQLVLISAALASCNKAFVPQQVTDKRLLDSTLTAAPVIDDSDSSSNPVCIPCLPDPCQLWSYSFDPFGYHYYIPVVPRHCPGWRVKGSIVWYGKSVVVRGGFGKSNFSKFAGT